MLKTRCCICGREIRDERQAREFSVFIEDERVATCSERCRQEAQERPAHCRVDFETVIELTPL